MVQTRQRFLRQSNHRSVQASASLWEGERSEVAGVNDSPVDCQSRHGIARRRWHGEAVTEGEKLKISVFSVVR